jgi:ABC-type Fe3+-hydroxamate transport system substrate-binding protein
MKPKLILLLLGLVWFGAGCARHYNITLSNNNTMSTHGKPKYDKATDTFKFKDSYGRVVILPAFRVKEIAPQ